MIEGLERTNEDIDANVSNPGTTRLIANVKNVNSTSIDQGRGYIQLEFEFTDIQRVFV